MKNYKLWTQKEVDTLEEMRLAGASCAQIAAALGRTLQSVRNRSLDEGFRRPRAFDAWMEHFRKPHTNEEIAARLGLSLYTIKRRKNLLHKAGFVTTRSHKIRGRGRKFLNQEVRTNGEIHNPSGV